ncbi:universal stress protein [Glycomyces xiaoerkulensis]|uniref:universal stress protein n=1 Tax=Glycomyces xiaoerkulensis TaxID=2038139 RepID=UPI000C25AF8E|nr:universal stress protein [Glycomyces xiaoerkulensis]
MASEENDQGRIVVGVDGSPSSQRALDWALGQAKTTGAKVEAVQAWQIPAAYGAAVIMLPGEEFENAARESLNNAIEQALSAHPGVEVERYALEAHPAKALLDRAEDADLLVLGSRGHGGFVGALIGSVSQHCINHAKCPVVVVRADT